MRNNRQNYWMILGAVLCLCTSASILADAPASIRVNLAQPGHAISPMLWGIFFEDINCSADGGIYAELVRNRNFEDSPEPEHWSLLSSGTSRAKMTVDKSQPASSKNPSSLKVEVEATGPGRVGVANSGFWGMGLVKGETYRLNLLARSKGIDKLTVALESSDGYVYARENISRIADDWKEFRLELVAKETDPKARLVISTVRPGTFWVDMVSLFPTRTWKGRANGLRPDLAQKLAELSPAFVRFPGGCWVEGDTMKDAYRWKQTIGPIAERRTQRNIWQYQATHGLGYHEYLQLCEDLKAEPLFVFNCGMSHREVVPMDKMGEYVQDALDAIEYANGPVTSTWGAVRARNGHPAPFGLKYMEIGNENGGPAYHERYGLFYDAIKAKYPDMHLVANEWNGRPSNRSIEILDEHYYSSPEFFIRQAGKYDSYNRQGHKVYVGEYAVTQGGGQGNLRAAVGEAAFMVGMERNSDVVVMSSYAPLFANVNYKKWNPDLINFDSSRVFGLPGYYVQQMFSRNRGDVLLPVAVTAAEVQPTAKTGGIGVGTWLTRAEFKDLKVTRGDQVLFQDDLSKGTSAWRLKGGKWSVQDGALHQDDLSENVRAFIGDKSWSNYTYTLKARKISGAEGFLIPFLVTDDDAKGWWNLGGWGNQRHGIEMDGVDQADVPGHIETGRWYSIRIEVEGTHIKCFLDDQLIHDVRSTPMKSLFTTASLDKRNSEAILKVVNVSSEAIPAEINFEGGHTAAPIKSLVLTSSNPTDENTLEEPERVAPRPVTLRLDNGRISHSFPGNSVTLVRVPLK